MAGVVASPLLTKILDDFISRFDLTITQCSLRHLSSLPMQSLDIDVISQSVILMCR